MGNTTYTWRVTNLWQKLGQNQQKQLREVLCGLDTDFLGEFAWKIAYILVSWKSYTDFMKYFNKRLIDSGVNYSDRYTNDPSINDAFFDSIDTVKERFRWIFEDDGITKG